MPKLPDKAGVHSFFSIIIIIIIIIVGIKGPKLYVGSWALSKDIDRFEEEQIVVTCSQLKCHK